MAGNNNKNKTAKAKSRSKKGRRDSFAAEVLVHLDALYSMGLRLTRNERDAEDLVQDSLVKAFRFRNSYEAGSNIKAWLFKILTRTFYNQIRKAKNIKKLESEAETGWHYERFISSATSAGRATEDLLLDAISSDRLRAAIEELPDDFRAVVILCDIHGFSYKEIAEIVDCPVGTVMSRLYRSRRQLQAKLYDYAVERGLVPAIVPSTITKQQTGQLRSATQTGQDEAEAAPTDLRAYREKRVEK